MSTELRIWTKVLSGGRVEVASPELVEGDVVDVSISRPERAEERRRSALEVIRRLQGHRMFSNAEEADAHLQAERDAWQR